MFKQAPFLLILGSYTYFGYSHTPPNFLPKSQNIKDVKVKLYMKCQLTGFIYQVALMDFSNVFTVLHFPSFIASLSKVVLPQGFPKVKTLVWGGIVVTGVIPGWVPWQKGMDSPEGNVKTSNWTFTSNFIT